MCGQTKPYDTEHWNVLFGRPGTRYCKTCAPKWANIARSERRARARLRQKAAEAAEAATAAGAAAAAGAESATPGRITNGPVPIASLAPAAGATAAGAKLRSAGARAPARPGKMDQALDISRALAAGVDLVNGAARRLVEQVVAHALDPMSPHHGWALKLLAERAIPVKMFAEAGTVAAGASPNSKPKAPSVTINVVAATPGGAPSRVITGEPVEAESVEDLL